MCFKENFADKWVETAKKQENFYKWLTAVQTDLNNILGQSGKGLQQINESMKKPFGESIITKTFSNYGESLKFKRESGSLNIAATSGMIGTAGTAIKKHNFYGTEEE